MTTKVKNTAIVLGGAVALSSGAYALGSQSGNGDAQAVTSSSPRTAAVASTSTQSRPTFRRGGFGRGRGFGRPVFDDLASKLGVSTAALQAALRDLGPDVRADHEQGLADALGVSEAKLRAALEKLRPDMGERHDDLAKALAEKLGVAESKVTSAFDTLRAQGPPQRGDRSDRRKALADAIGVSEAALEKAFRELRQNFRAHRPERRGDHVADLAKALGLSTE